MRPYIMLFAMMCLLLAVDGSSLKDINSSHHMRGRTLTHAAVAKTAKGDDDDEGDDDDDDDDDESSKSEHSSGGGYGKSKTKEESPKQEEKKEEYPPKYPEEKKEEYPPKYPEEKKEEYPPKYPEEKKEEYPPKYPEEKKEAYPPKYPEEKKEEYPPKYPEPAHAEAYPPKYPEPAYFPTPHGETKKEEYEEMMANEQYCENRKLRGVHRFLQGVFCPASVASERREDNIPSAGGWISFATVLVFCFLFCPGIIMCCQSRGFCQCCGPNTKPMGFGTPYSGGGGNAMLGSDNNYTDGENYDGMSDATLQ